MLKVLFSGLLVCFGSLSWSQNKVDANVLFDNFEYELAAIAYEAKNAKEKSQLVNKEKLAYCYYQTGNFTKGIPLTESLIQFDSTSGHYWFWKATLEKEKGDYSKAAAFFRKVQQLDNSYDVEVLITSCELIPTWSTWPRSTVELLPENDKWANNYTRLGENVFLYFENGKDSASNDLNLSRQSNTFAELLLMKAFSLNSTASSPLFTDPQLASFSLSSISGFTDDGTFYFSANDPIAQDNLAHIYKGMLDEEEKISNTSLVIDLNPSKDTAAYAHPAITSDGKTMVFTKMSKYTNGSDLFITEKANDRWSTPRPLVYLNTEKDEMFPKIIGDSLLTFSSNGRVGYGDLDIYSIDLSEIESGKEPIHLKAPVNSSADDFNFEWTSDTTALFVSNRKNGAGDDDVYALLVKKEMPIEPISIVDTTFQNWMAKWNRCQLYFEYDKRESILDTELLEGIKKYTDQKKFHILLTGHTDARGTIEYNQKLGMQRAEWVRVELNKVGVPYEAISTLSVGETQLVNDCGDDKNCTEAEMRLNRFVEIHLQSTDSIQTTTP